MTANFKPQNQPAIIANKFAIPVGTSVILSYDKFMFDKRDINCTGCKNGFKSTLPKKIDNKTYSVNVICTCVPYYQSKDADGTGIVVYKGRRELWTKGVRPEAEVQAELIREQVGKNALERKNEVEDNLRANTNVNGNSKYQKALREKVDIEKAKQNGAKPPQKVLQQDKNGHWIYVTLEQGQKLGGRVSDPLNPTMDLDKPNTPPAPPASAQNPEQAVGLRPESDAEFLARTTGQAIVQEETNFITVDQAAKIEAARLAATQAPAPVVTAPAAVVTAPAQPTAVKPTGKRGRPAGSKNKPKE